jgi:hypothetical protein
MHVRRSLLVVAGLGVGFVVLGLLVGSWLGRARPEPSLADKVFRVKPYVQLGDAPAASARESLEVLWHAADRDERWSVEARPADGQPWRRFEASVLRRIAVEGIEPHRVYRARLTDLTPGAEVPYRVWHEDRPVFEATARARKGAGQPHRFAAFGDCGAGSGEQKAVAYQAWLARPDFVMLTGDIVYFKGRIAEYREKFYPIYNGDHAAPKLGAPLLRSTLFLAAPGNHDLIQRDLDLIPDGLAYFLYWSQPLNGPIVDPNSASAPKPLGTEAHRRAFLDAAGSSYPRMANFSFDYGGAHWTVLDANPYVDWTDPALRGWVERDLDAARQASWRFVAYHQPGFHSSKTHADDQRSRRLAELFEKGRVDIVFSGHVHNYQRSYPLKFNATAEPANIDPRGMQLVNGQWMLDKTFDGITRTRPDGIIYIVTGAGGARLYNPDQHDDPASWLEFTAKFISSIHSLTVVDVEPAKLTLRQISKNGKELDRIVVTKDKRDGE